MTERDERMLNWLSVVRLADMDALRWALGGFQGDGRPVTLRRAQQWVARLAAVGLVDRARPTFRDGSLVWATHQAVGKVAPNLYRQTTRHEAAVAAVAARYVCHGYEWRRDRPAPSSREHMADGVAMRGDSVELVEVELTPKRMPRYQVIMTNHAWRLAREGVSRVRYFSTAEAARSIDDNADRFVMRGDRDRILSHVAFDLRGGWNVNEGMIWTDEVYAVQPQLPSASSVDTYAATAGSDR